MVTILALLLGVVAAGASAATTSATRSITTGYVTNPYHTPTPDACATVSSYIQEASDAEPTVLTDYPHVPARYALECMLSVPFNATAAGEWLESLKPYLQWQSTTSYLKDWTGIKDFRNPDKTGFDIFDRLQFMIDNVALYPSEYHFQHDLYNMFANARDGHLRYFPKLVSGIFGFGRPITLVSISVDGQSKPRVYHYDDVISSATGTTEWHPHVVKIDNQDVDDKLADIAAWAVSRDDDAAYNTLFANLAQGALGYLGNGGGIFAGGGRGQVQYPGSHTNITFSNGTTLNWTNFARVFQSFDNITTGQDLRDRYLDVFSHSSAGVPNEAESSDRPGHIEPDVAPPDTINGPPGYPQPVKAVAGGYMGGYYMQGQGYEDAAVLSLPSFGTSIVQTAMQQTVTDFLLQAKADGKVRLIIDLSANGGGQIPQAYSIFKTLFPDIDPYGASRFRAHEDFDIVGQAVSEAVGSDYPWDYDYPPGSGLLLNTYLATPFIAQADLTEDGRAFSSWAEKFGPHEFHGDNFTTLLRWNLSDPGAKAFSTFIPNGYGNRTNVVSERPFQAEDIIILTDGYCASTCSIFVEFMTKQANVKTVAIGGRPGKSSIGPMQAVGGVRGVNLYYFSSVAEFARGVPYLSEQASVRQLSLAEKYSRLPLLKSSSGDGSLNVRDDIRMGDTTQTPLQFIYEQADCRLFYERQHVYNMMSMWMSVYDAAWYGARCVAGSAYSPPQSTVGEQRQERRAVTLSPEEVEQLRDRWQIVTDMHRIEPMNGFQLP